MRDDAERWKRLDEAEVRRQKQKSVDELHNDGYQLYGRTANVVVDKLRLFFPRRHHWQNRRGICQRNVKISIGKDTAIIEILS